MTTDRWCLQMCCWEKPAEALQASDNLTLLLSWIYEEAYRLLATTRNPDAVQMKIVLPHIAKWHKAHESIELSNEMRKMCYRNYERVIPFLTQVTLEEAQPAPDIYLFKREDVQPIYADTDAGQTFQCVMGRLGGVIDTLKASPDCARSIFNPRQQNKGD